MKSKNWWPNHYSQSQIENYEVKRQSKKWRSEQIFIRNILKGEGKKLQVSNLLDAPSGTGRFFQIYKEINISDITALDVSHAMLNKSKLKTGGLEKINFVQGDISKLPFADKSFDYTVCWRFITWVPANKIQVVLNELNRVTNRKILISIYFWNNSYSWRRILFFIKNVVSKKIFKSYIRIQNKEKFYAIAKKNNLIVENEIKLDQNNSTNYVGLVLKRKDITTPDA